MTFSAPSSISALWCLVLLHFLWQGALVAGAAWLVAAALRRHSAQAEYCCLTIGLLLMPLACFATAAMLVAQMPERSDTVATLASSPSTTVVATTVIGPNPGETQSTPPAQSLPERGRDGVVAGADYSTALVALYWSGVAVLLARVVLGVRGGRRLCGQAVPVEDPALLEKIVAWSRAVGLRRVPTLTYCRGVAVPTVFGLLQSTILLPLAAAPGLTLAELEAIVLHELMHLRRHDHWVNLLQRCVEAMLFFHPVVWFLSRRISVVREHCCDDAVLGLGAERQVYIDSLVRVAELSFQERRPAERAALVGLSALGRPSQLRQRIARLLGQPLACSVRLKPAGVWVLCLVIVSMAAGALAATALAQPDGGQRAEAPQEKSVQPQDDSKKPKSPSPSPSPSPRQTGDDKVEPKTEAARLFLHAIAYQQNKDGSFPAKALDKLRKWIGKQLEKEPKWDNAAAAKTWLERTAKDRTWTRAELVPLVDEAASWSVPVLAWAELNETLASFNVVKKGDTLPEDKFKGYVFGPPADNGLRVALVLEPAKALYAVGEVVPIKFIFLNTGKAPVQFVTETWRQMDTWSVKDGKDNAIKIRGVFYTGITPYRRSLLQPGQSVEVGAPGVAIGEGEYKAEFRAGVLGTVLSVQAGDEIRVSLELTVPGFGNSQVPGNGDWNGTLKTGEIKFRVVAPGPAGK